MRTGQIAIEGAGYLLGVVLSLGSSQVYGLVKGSVDLINRIQTSIKLQGYKDFNKKIERGVSLKDMKEIDHFKKFSAEIEINDEQIIKNSDYVRKQLQNFVIANINKNESKLVRNTNSLRADAAALIPLIGAIVSWRLAHPRVKGGSLAASDYDRAGSLTNSLWQTTHMTEIYEMSHDTLDRHLEIFGEIFKGSSQAEVYEIYLRMHRYSTASGVLPDIMVQNVKKGFELAQDIAEGNINQAEGHPVQDLIDVDWFLRAHMAKLGKLYLKGTVKFADPDMKFAKFIVNCKGMYHGQEVNSIGRCSSHWPEKANERMEMPIEIDDMYYTFSSDTKNKLIRTSETPSEKIHDFGYEAIGIDASGPKNNPSLGLAGEDNNTFLIMFIPDKDAEGKEVLSIGMKTEGFSAVSILAFGYGTMINRIIDVIKHTVQWADKKGPDFLRVPVSQSKSYRDLKEDKLNKEIRGLLAEVNFLMGNVNGTELEQRLYRSYEELQSTKKLGSEYGLQELRQYLIDLLPIISTVKLENFDKEKQAAVALIEKIDSYNDEVRHLSKNWRTQLLPRSEEVILPSIDEMVEDRTPFIGRVRERE